MTSSNLKNKSFVMRMAQLLLLLSVPVLLSSCAKRHVKHAPVVERGVEISKSSAESAKKPVAAAKPTQAYVVQKGDTMYGIAFMHGVDYRDVAELNNIDNPASIQVGQELRIPVPTPSKIAESKPVSRPTTAPGGIKSQPKTGKIPYSATALAQAERMQDEQPATAKDADDDEDMEWGMPTSGKIVAGFSESDNRKGVDISGKQGQAVVASASGKVVYSGSGLRGYGKLVIIKHNKTYLSAYAHNDQILVKEGQSVSKGQKIGEMGNTDSDQVKLHFEIRKFGKPVDPAQFLPLVKS